MCVTSLQDGGPAASPHSHFPHKAFWVSLSASLLLVLIVLGLTGHLGLSDPHSQVMMHTPRIPQHLTEVLEK